MRHVGVGPGAPACVSEEKERVVCGGGGVVRRLRDGSAQLLFADGSVATAASDATADDLEWTLLEGACVKDAATGARVWLQGATSLTIFEDGVVLAKHADGTIIRTCEHHVIVECPGLAAVEIDTDIDATATAHASTGFVTAYDRAWTGGPSKWLRRVTTARAPFIDRDA